MHFCPVRGRNSGLAAVESGGKQQFTELLHLVFRAIVIADKNERQMLLHLSFILMERVTRLELATSTLARWRSTG